MGKRVYLGLGSNLGNKERIVRKAIDKVGERVGAVVAVSSFYKTAPWGYQSVHTFCNAAISVDTDLSPEEVLFTVQEIERELGSKKHRERDGSYVDRLIDIDLLDYDGLVLDTHSLVLPHPYMHKRTFVMTPLAEIAPQWVHPVLGKTATELLEGRPALSNHLCFRGNCGLSSSNNVSLLFRRETNELFVYLGIGVGRTPR